MFVRLFLIVRLFACNIYIIHNTTNTPPVYQVLLESGRFVKPIRLGGSLKLSGEQVSVAVFQGEKFRDDTWALVNLSKVRMKYETQVEEFAKVCRI